MGKGLATKKNFFEALIKFKKIWPLSSRGEGGKALVGEPQKNYFFCGFPYVCNFEF